MDWSTYSARRRVKLEQFIAGAEDETAAHKLFTDKEIVPPSEEIFAFFNEKRLSAVKKVAVSKKKEVESASSAETGQQE